MDQRPGDEVVPGTDGARGVPFRSVPSIGPPPVVKTTAKTAPLVTPVVTDIFTGSLPIGVSITARQRVAVPPTPTVPYDGHDVTGVSVIKTGVRPVIRVVGECVTTGVKRQHPCLSLDKPGGVYPTTDPVVLTIGPGYAGRNIILGCSPVRNELKECVSIAGNPGTIGVPGEMEEGGLRFPFLLYVSVVFFLFCLVGRTGMRSGKRMQLFGVSISLIVVNDFSVSSFQSPSSVYFS